MRSEVRMPTAEFTVRPAREADLPSITDIYRPAVVSGTASFELDPPDVAEMRRRWEAITRAGYPYFVADRAGELLGYAYASAYRTRPGYRFTVEDSIYVRQDTQRSGVGKRLLAALVSHCTDQGFRQMIAVIGDSRSYGSITLHRSLGFSFIGTIHAVGFKHGRWLDSVLMQRALGPGESSLPESDPQMTR
jgi:phosphinothricin acetyltransferase